VVVRCAARQVDQRLPVSQSKVGQAPAKTPSRGAPSSAAIVEHFS
jgi:hypothetical protein